MDHRSYVMKYDLTPLYVICIALLVYATATTTVMSASSFWKTIGSPRFISAPMVDQSNLAWRLFVRRNGADLAFSQMMHARNFVVDKGYRSDCIDWVDYRATNGSLAAEENAKKLDRPLIVQLAGDNPDTLVAAGKYLEKDATAIDLNLGCPQMIAKRGHYGAYLLPEKELIVKLLTAMVTQLNCPITAKIRILPKEDDTIELCKAIEQCGVQMLTVHGRTVASSKLFTGKADWDIIRKIKQSLSIPVVANGGIGCRADALNCLSHTGADAVMSSEGLLENPKLFSEDGDYQFRENYVMAQMNTVKEFLATVAAYPLPRPLEGVVRGHLFKMLYRFISVPANYGFRETLSKASYAEMHLMVEELDRKMATISYDTEEAIRLGLVGSTNWYMRHRDGKAAIRILSQPRPKFTDSGVRIELQPPNAFTDHQPPTNQEILKSRLKAKFGKLLYDKNL